MLDHERRMQLIVALQYHSVEKVCCFNQLHVLCHFDSQFPVLYQTKFSGIQHILISPGHRRGCINQIGGAQRRGK